MEFRFGGLDSRFWLWNEVFLSSPEVSGRKWLTDWKAEIGDYVQDLSREALFSEWSFPRNEGECANRVMKIDFYYLAGYNVDLISK